MRPRKEKAADLRQQIDGNDSETKRSSKERIVTNAISAPRAADRDWNGHVPEAS